jgi:nitrate reductase alpha subunit
MPLDIVSFVENPFFADPFAASFDADNDAKLSLSGHVIDSNYSSNYTKKISDIVENTKIDVTVTVDLFQDIDLERLLIGTIVFGQLIENKIVIKEVDVNSNPDELEQAEKDDFLGTVQQIAGNITFKFSDKKTEELENSGFESVEYQSASEIKTISRDNFSFDVLSEKERVWLITKVKSQIVYLRTLHSDDKKTEETIKYFTSVLHVLENKIQVDKGQNKPIIFRVYRVIKDKKTSSVEEQILLIIKKSIEEKKEIEKEERLVEKYYWIIKKNVIKTEANRLERIERCDEFDILITEISKKVIR